MSASFSTTGGNVVVVTHVQPVAQGAGHAHCQGSHKFSRGQPVVLGTVEIMIGVMVLLFGTSMAFNADTLGVYSGIFVWGSLLYITAGSLTVAAGKTFNRCLENGALAVNVCAAVSSLTATILYFLDTAGIVFGYYIDYPYITRMQGISGVLGVFHLLELVVSLTIAGFVCSATCKCCREEPSVIVIPETGSELPVPRPSQMMSISKIPEDPRAVGFPAPPAYTAIVG